MTTAFARYDDLLHQVYDSALMPARWPATLGAIAEVFDARSVVLWTFMHGVEQGGICFTHALDQLGFEAFATVSPAEDPFAQALLARQLLIDGAAYKESDMLPRERVLESRLYRELWSTQGIDQVAVGIVFSGTDGRQLPVAICLYRSAPDLPFGDAEIDLLRRLLAHLSRSLGVMFHLQDATHQVIASRSALDRLGAGVVLLDAHGRVQFANAAAERLLTHGSLVRLAPQEARGSYASTRPDRLASTSPSGAIQAAFTKALNAALEPYLDGDTDHFSEAVVLPDENGKPAVVMNAAPLGQATGLSPAEAPARAIVFFYELSGQRAVAPERLRQIFGMTQAEARAAMQLLESGSTQDMADRLGVSLNTFKTQIKAAYAKTNTNRQSSLLRLMLSLGPA